MARAVVSTVLPDLNLNNVLFELQRVKFPAEKWKSLANGLRLAAAVSIIETDQRGVVDKLQALISRWVKSTTQPNQWITLVEAIVMCDEPAVARDLATAVGVDYPPHSGGVERPIKQYVRGDQGTLTVYVDRLKRVYQNSPTTWLSLPNCKHIKLAVTKEKGMRDAQIECRVKGEIEPLMDSKVPVDMDSIFDDGTFANARRPMVILVEGALGSGKTSLAYHYCQKWAEGNLSMFDVVALVYLRYPAVHSAGLDLTLHQLLLLACASDGEKEIEDVVGKVVQHVKNGLKLLLILDGWDEAPDCLRDPPDIRYPLDNSYLGKFLRSVSSNTTILITSRPDSSLDLHNRANVNRVVILGFTKESIHDYFLEALSTQLSSDEVKNEITKLRDHFRKYPAIESSCYIPLNAAILIFVHLEHNCTLPTTHYELLYQLLLCCINREVKTRQPKQILSTISSLDDLPRDLKEQLDSICILAYEGIMQNKVVFIQDELPSILPTPAQEDLPTMGVLQRVRWFSISSKTMSYNFVHLSIQELLAAYCISKMKESKQVRVFQTLLGKPRFSAVLQFYAGFSKLINQGVRNIITGTDFTGDESSKLSLLSYMRCFFEAQIIDESFYQQIIPKLNGKIDASCVSMSPLDCMAFGYFLAFVLSNTSELCVDLSYCSIDDHSLCLLMGELSKHAEQGNLHRVTELNFSRNKIGNDGIAHVATALQTNATLRALNIIHCSVSDEGAESLARALAVNRSLQLLDISCNEISDNGIAHVATALQINTTLRTLNISLCSVSDEGAESLARALAVNRSLQKLAISCNEISDNGIAHVATALQINTTLRTLNISHCSVSDEGAESLARALAVNRSLQLLDISCNEISDNGIAHIATALQTNTALKTLTVSATDNELMQKKFNASKKSCKVFFVDKDLTVLPDPVNPDDAMKSLGETVTMKITNIGAQGYPGIGKTSVLDLAMGKEPASTRTSTDCIELPYMMIKSEDSDGKIRWEKVGTDKMFRMVCEAVKKTIEDIPPDNAVSIATVSQSTEHAIPAVAKEHIATLAIAKEHASLAVVKKEATPAVEQVPPPSASSMQTPDLPSHDSSLDPSSDSIPPSIWFSRLINQLAQRTGNKTSGVIFNSHWVFVNDCGGQPPFLDAAALFPQNICLQIFPLKLDESLNKRAEFSYYVNDKPAKIDQGVLLTHEQIIETLAKSVAAIQPPYIPSAIVSPSVAKFTIVGTFYDQLQVKKCPETLQDKLSTLKTLLKPYMDFHVGSELILPLNAITKGEKRKDLTKELQTLIFDTSDVTMNVEMRLCWFGFYLSLLTTAEKEEKAVLKLDECYTIGHSLGMDNDETDNAIRLFHSIGLIMHFNTTFENLKNFVIVFTKPVLKTVSKIISVSFLDMDFLKGQKINVSIGDKNQLQYYGFLKVHTLKKCLDSKIDEELLLKILEHVKIIAKLPREDYFMPCALSYAQPKDLHEILNDLPPYPWVIKLREERGVIDDYIPIPVGYLPTLAIFLLTQDKTPFSTNRSKLQYRNVINLQYKRRGTVYLVEHHFQLEVYYSYCDDLPDQCSAIRCLVRESMQLTEERLRIREGAITMVDSFLCPCDSEKDMCTSSGHHTCFYISPEKIECCKQEKIITYALETHHLCWLSSESTTTSRDSNVHPSATSLSASQQSADQEQATTETAYEDELLLRKRHKQGNEPLTATPARYYQQQPPQGYCPYGAPPPNQGGHPGHNAPPPQASYASPPQASYAPPPQASYAPPPGSGTAPPPPAGHYQQPPPQAPPPNQGGYSAGYNAPPPQASYASGIAPPPPAGYYQQPPPQGYYPCGAPPPNQGGYPGYNAPLPGYGAPPPGTYPGCGAPPRGQPAYNYGAPPPGQQPPYGYYQQPGTHVQVASESSNTLGIDELVEVKNTLKKVNDWQSLGLQLGLLYPTLEKIETDNNSKVEQCKTKMIAAWLKRQDNVLKVGVPSWSVLKAALRKIGEGEVADQIVT